MTVMVRVPTRQELLAAVAKPHTVPLTDPDPRLHDLYVEGLIEPGDTHWRIVYRRVVPLPADVRDDIDFDRAHVRRADSIGMAA